MQKLVRHKKYLLFVVAIFFVATGMVIFFQMDPNGYPFFPKCPFLVITGFECPGCGSQRAIHQLLHLNIVGAFNQNPLVVLYLPYVVWGLYLEYFGGSKKFPRILNALYGKRAAIIILCSIVLFWVGRNIF